VQLQRDGNQTRTKLIWEKTRWATLPSETVPKACLLEWVIETQGYTVTELDTVGASDSELEERIAAYLSEQPLSNTRAVWENVRAPTSASRDCSKATDSTTSKARDKRNCGFWRRLIRKRPNRCRINRARTRMGKGID
jgi:hypothetical protein